MLHQIPRASFLRYVPLVVAALLLVPFAALAQSDTGSLSGTVKDQNGAIIPGATVTAKNLKTGDERTATTNGDGLFAIAALKASTYEVTATTTGLGVKVSNVDVNVGRESTLNLILKVMDLTASINIVASEEVATNTGNASMGANVNPREVQGLPLNGRQLSQLYLQAPGSVNSGSGTYGDIRFSGRAVEQNEIRYDGIEGSAIIDTSPGNLNGEIPTPFRLQSSLENVQEFRVESNNYPAEFGTGTGGQISVVTKSGGNKFHGSAFEYLRNDKLDAANFFDNIIGQKSKLRMNQFGGSIGGPIKKDKAFFFFSYEGYRLRGGINAIEAVPGQASRICAPPLGTGAVACNAATAALIPAFRGTGAVTLRTGPDLFDTVQLQANNIVNESSTALRVDYKLNQKHSTYFRFFRDQAFNSQPDGVTGRRIVIKQIPQNGVVALQSVLTQNLLNEFKFGYNGAYSRIVGQAPIVNGIDLSNLSFNIAGSVAGFSLPGQGANAGVAVPGGLIRANSAQNGRGQPYTPYSLSYIDNLNWTHGTHTVKVGGEIRAVRLYTDRQGGLTYTFSSINSFLANSLQSAQFLGDLSAPSPFFNNSTGPAFARQNYYIAYGQDEWKIKPNLTLSYGLRYEYYSPLKEANNRQIYFDIVTGVLRDPTGNPFHSSKSNFGPRIAATWSPNPTGNGFFSGGRTVLRGGFGIYYGPGQTEDQIQPIESNRVSSTLSPASGTVLTYPQDPNLIAANFVNNPSNRQYQPRAYAPEYTIPEKIYQYGVSVQQELPYKLVLTAGFVGSQGRNLFLRSIANRILPGQTTIGPSATTLPAGFGVVNVTDAAGNVVAVRTVREFSIINGTAAPLNPYAEIDDKTSGGHDSYKALQLSLGRRFSTGLTLNSQYSFSRSFGNTSGSNEARTAANNARATSEFDYDLGYNNFDVRHTFNLSALYDLPFGKGKKYDFGGAGNAILGNWEVGTIINARSGLPLEIGIVRPDVVIQCVNAAGCGGLPTGFVAQLSGNPPAGFIAVVNTPGGGASRNVRRPDLIPGVSPYLTNDRLILNPAAFTTPAPGKFGDAPRNFLRGPNFQQFDLVFIKRFRFSESTNLEFRTEIFNVFNRANFDIPGSRLNLSLPTVACAGGVCTASGNNTQPGTAYTQSTAGGTFGLLRQTVVRDVGLGTSRQIQFALRLNF